MPERLQESFGVAAQIHSQADWRSFVELLRYRASNQPEQVAFLFPRDRAANADNFHRISYASLDQQARSIAATLQAAGISAGQKVLLLHQPGADFVTAFFGCLYAGTVAVTTYLGHRGRLKQGLPKIVELLKDAECRCILMSTDVAQPFKAAWEEVIGGGEHQVNQPPVIASDDIPPTIADAWHPPAIHRETVTLLQYTSGSTSRPRGVMITHGNLLHNSSLIQRGFESGSSSVGLIWLPPYHDMGLIGGILQPVFAGFPVTLMSPLAFLQQPFSWLQTISRIRATITGGPNFAYELCVRKVTPEQCSTLDLSSWKIAFNGAEPIHADTIKRFSAAFAPCGFNPKAFYPCYGLAEATLFVTGGKALAGPRVLHLDRKALEQDTALLAGTTSKDIKAVVGCGEVPSDQKVAIVDPESRCACPDKSVGEIWVSGPSVSSGYWNRPDETFNAFVAYRSDTGEGPFLRTGDLGFFHQGELFVTGRLKDIVIIHGRNFYPHDLEITAQSSHPGLQPGSGAIFSVEYDGQERLVIAQEVQREALRTDPLEMVSAIRQAIIRDFDVQAYAIVLLKPGQVPKTSSGKIRRALCKSALMSNSLETVHLHPSPESPFWRKDAAACERP
jgi:acyl-CoA synthetase (AMP-forming)/AMP-acid ligase II